MDDFRSSIISSDDAQLIGIIRLARTKLILLAPGVSVAVAKEVCDRWVEMEPSAVQVLLDTDPEVCRMGYGEIGAIQLLQTTATELKSSIHHRPGIRVGVLITDATTLVFSPTPLLVEHLSAKDAPPNAVRFETSGPSPSMMGTLSEEADDLIQGGEPLTEERVQYASKDLAANPPLKFDLAQKVRVFNAQFEFVEFELKGLLISRKTIPIPSDLMGLAKDTKTQKLLRSSFRVVGEDSEISGERVVRLKEYILKRYLRVLPGYGSVVLRSNKDNFQIAVRTLTKAVIRFQKSVREKLQAEMDTNRDILGHALAPTVCAKPPQRWASLLSPNPTKEQVGRLLDNELEKAFGSAKQLLGEMKVKVTFKGVTYELLNDPKFMETAKKAIPSLDFLHEEYDAARAS